MFRQGSLATQAARWHGGHQDVGRKRRLILERMESRYLLDAAAVTLVDDLFDVHQNSLPDELDVLANDHFGSDYSGPRDITSVSYGSEGGSVAIADDGKSIRYAPPADFFGTETLLYVVDNQYTANVQVAIDAPLAFDEYAIPPDGTQRRLDVLANDPSGPITTGRNRSRPSASPVLAVPWKSTTTGSSLRYTPPDEAFGKDDFIYIVDEHLSGTGHDFDPARRSKHDRFEIVQNTQNTLRVLANDPFWPGYPGERAHHARDRHAA